MERLNLLRVTQRKALHFLFLKKTYIYHYVPFVQACSPLPSCACYRTSRAVTKMVKGRKSYFVLPKSLLYLAWLFTISSPLTFIWPLWLQGIKIDKSITKFSSRNSIIILFRKKYGIKKINQNLLGIKSNYFYVVILNQALLFNQIKQLLIETYYDMLTLETASQYSWLGFVIDNLGEFNSHIVWIHSICISEIYEIQVQGCSAMSSYSFLLQRDSQNSRDTWRNPFQGNQNRAELFLFPGESFGNQIWRQKKRWFLKESELYNKEINQWWEDQKQNMLVILQELVSKIVKPKSPKSKPSAKHVFPLFGV